MQHFEHSDSNHDYRNFKGNSVLFRSVNLCPVMVKISRQANESQPLSTPCAFLKNDFVVDAEFTRSRRAH